MHSFEAEKGGYWPGAGVVVDAAGNLYGTAGVGGGDCVCGVVYKLAPNPDGTWTYTVLHRSSRGGVLPQRTIPDEKSRLVVSGHTDVQAGAKQRFPPARPLAKNPARFRLLRGSFSGHFS